MKNGLFHGYNCFSSAIGQHLANVKQSAALETVTVRWTFDFNREWLKNNVWCAGACVEPSDYLLQYDLYRMEGIRIETCRADFEKSQEEMRRDIAAYGSHVVQLDFYYLTSIDWKKMERFGYYPQHLPHYICVTGVEEDQVLYQDPMYRYSGSITAADLEYARTRRVCEMDLYRTYYKFNWENSRQPYTLEEKIKYQLTRYLENEQFEMIEKFAEALGESCEEFQETDVFDWAFNCYLSLDSVALQRQAFLQAVRKKYPECQDLVMPLVEDWIHLKKSFHQIYSEKNAAFLKNIIGLLKTILSKEQETVEQMRRKI